MVVLTDGKYEKASTAPGEGEMVWRRATRKGYIEGCLLAKVAVDWKELNVYFGKNERTPAAFADTGDRILGEEGKSSHPNLDRVYLAWEKSDADSKGQQRGRKPDENWRTPIRRRKGLPGLERLLAKAADRSREKKGRISDKLGRLRSKRFVETRHRQLKKGAEKTPSRPS